MYAIVKSLKMYAFISFYLCQLTLVIIGLGELHGYGDQHRAVRLQPAGPPQLSAQRGRRSQVLGRTERR